MTTPAALALLLAQLPALLPSLQPSPQRQPPDLHPHLHPHNQLPRCYLRLTFTRAFCAAEHGHITTTNALQCPDARSYMRMMSRLDMA